MKVVGFSGYSGSGKTTLVEQLTRLLTARGLCVSVVKHAHHSFDIDHEGKDSWRHREAGAFEVVIASNLRLAKIREYPVAAEPAVHDLLKELAPCDWVFVEGFKRAAIPKIEVWRAANGKPVQYPHDEHIVAVCTDSPGLLPVVPRRPLLDLGNSEAVVAYLLSTSEHYEYIAPAADPTARATASPDAVARRGDRPASRRSPPAAGD